MSVEDVETVTLKLSTSTHGVPAYLRFAHQEWHEDSSDAFPKDDGEDDAAGYIQQHDPHPHPPAPITSVRLALDTARVQTLLHRWLKWGA